MRYFLYVLLSNGRMPYSYPSITTSVLYFNLCLHLHWWIYRDHQVTHPRYIRYNVNTADVTLSMCRLQSSTMSSLWMHPISSLAYRIMHRKQSCIEMLIKLNLDLLMWQKIWYWNWADLPALVSTKINLWCQGPIYKGYLLFFCADLGIQNSETILHQ